MYIGKFRQGQSVWVPALSHHTITGAEMAGACTGYYQKMVGAPGAGTALTFNQFNTETGGYFAVISTTLLDPGAYFVFVEATVGGVASNAVYTFEVEAAFASPSAGVAATSGECLSVAELKTFIEYGSLSDGALQDILDRAWGDIFDQLGHTFGRAFRIYHDESESATAATIEIDATGVELIITGGANDGTYTYTFAVHTEIGGLIQAIEDEAVGFVVELLEQIPYDQPSANLKVLAATDIFGAENRRAVYFSQWTECVSGNNEHIARLTLKVRTTVSVAEDGVALTAGTDYFIKPFHLLRWCQTGATGVTCGLSGYWSCKQPCNVCITYVPAWFGQCPKAVEKLLIALSQGLIESYMDGTYKSERIGDYSYTKGSHAETIGYLWGEVLGKYSIMHWISV